MLSREISGRRRYVKIYCDRNTLHWDIYKCSCGRTRDIAAETSSIALETNNFDVDQSCIAAKTLVNANILSVSAARILYKAAEVSIFPEVSSDIAAKLAITT